MKILLTTLMLLTSSLSQAKIKVVTTVTDIRWAVEVIGGDKVEVSSFLNGYEDPHHVDAVPKYITMAANADVVCSVGLSLEIGWLPRVLQKSEIDKCNEAAKVFVSLGQWSTRLTLPEVALTDLWGTYIQRATLTSGLGLATIWWRLKLFLTP